MLGFKTSAGASSARTGAGMFDAINRVQAVIEFGLDGTIQHANENFLNAMGYSLDEVRGKHHSMFVEPAYRDSAEYKLFWEKLGRGDFDAGQYKRLGKGGREVWIQASYNPVFDTGGKPVKVVKFATDITEQKLKNTDYEGQIAAISKAQAVIAFSLDGKILDANENFLKTLGYTLDEVKGQHHAMFVEPAYRQSAEYKAFWEKLGRGEYDAAQYKRIGKGGREVWIQASYNPIMDLNGKPFKVVKYATDITASMMKSHALQQAVKELQHVIELAQNKDLTELIPLDGKSDEVETLCRGVNGLIGTMAAVISNIKKSVREVSNASAEISTSTTDLSQRTEEQAASLEQTSASMEEMAATVKKNAENAQQANQSASGTQVVADRGGEVVAKAVDAMARIEESSRKISDIIGVIDEIARQTNLLALNAAVEAARAGEAGRGFAVVASEVRSLAQRSSQAAKDIKDLITNSNSQVKDGVELVNKAGAALTEIVELIKKVAQVVSEIAAASAEQATGIEQVNKALTQMDEVTQQNSALVEENAATAKTLEQQAKAMDDEVSLFHVEQDEAGEASAQAKHSPARPETPAPRSANTRAVAPKAAEPKVTAPKTTPAKTATVKAPAAAHRSNPVGRMQAAVAAAVGDPQWQEF